MHEYGTVSLEMGAPEPRFELNINNQSEHQKRKLSPQATTDRKSQFDEAVKLSQDGKSKFDSLLEAQQSAAASGDAKSQFDAAVQSQTAGNATDQSHKDAVGHTSVSASVVGQILNQSTPAHHQQAATKIQVSARKLCNKKETLFIHSIQLCIVSKNSPCWTVKNSSFKWSASHVTCLRKQQPCHRCGVCVRVCA